jgi:hypothetical protein
MTPPGNSLRDNFTCRSNEFRRSQDDFGRRTIGFGDNPRVYPRRQYEDEDNGFEDELRDDFRNKPKRDYERWIANLVKMYTEEDKYGGDGNDNFDYKLIIFHDNCDTAGIPQSLWNKAYPRMLQGLARHHYFTNWKNNPQTPTLEQLCNTTHNYFEGEEYCCRMLERWNILTLKKVINRVENSEKTTIDYLELLILELRQVQNGLDPDL